MAQSHSGELSYRNNANELKELEHMVMSFRIYELQHLLGYANRCRTGKKPELLHRALDLIRTSKNLAIQQKVRELARGRVNDRGSTNALPDDISAELINGYAGSAYHPSTQAYNLTTNSSAPCLTNYPATMTSVISTNSNLAENSAIWHSACRQNLSLYPDVKLTPLPFYDLLTEVVKPTTLVPLTVEKFQENFITFSLPQRYVEELAYNDVAPLPRIELQLRFCLLDMSGEQKDDFPSACNVRMNDKIVQLPNPIPTNKVGVEPKRPSRPVNITPYCRPSAGVQRIHIAWNNDGVRYWTASVYIVRHITASMLLNRLTAKGERPTSVTADMIKEKLNSDNDHDIATTSLRVSLLCPLGKMRMRLPCRLSQCNHLQCFDGDLFLRMNEKRPTWTCPVCDKPTPFNDIKLDGYFMDIIEKTADNECDVELYEDGRWAAVVEKDDNTTSVSSEKRKVSDRKVSAAVADVADATQAESSGSMLSSAVGRPQTVYQDISVIDLTEDDSDDDRTGAGADSESSSSTPCYSSRLLGWNRMRITNRSSRRHHDSPSASTSPSIIVLDSPPSTSAANEPIDNGGESGNFNRKSSLPTWSDQASSSNSARSSSNSVIITQETLSRSEVSSSPPKKRYAADRLTPAQAPASSSTVAANDLSSAFMASSFMNSTAMNHQNLATQSRGTFGCGIPLLSAGVDLTDPTEALSAATAFGQLLATANSTYRNQAHQQQGSSGSQGYVPGNNLSNSASVPNIYGLPSHSLRLGQASASYFLNPVSYNVPVTYSMDFLNPVSASADRLATTAIANNLLPGPNGDSIWDNRWSQDFQDFLNSCLPDSSSRPS